MASPQSQHMVSGSSERKRFLAMFGDGRPESGAWTCCGFIRANCTERFCFLRDANSGWPLRQGSKFFNLSLNHPRIVLPAKLAQADLGKALERISHDAAIGVFQATKFSSRQGITTSRRFTQALLRACPKIHQKWFGQVGCCQKQMPNKGSKFMSNGNMRPNQPIPKHIHDSMCPASTPEARIGRSYSVLMPGSASSTY